MAVGGGETEDGDRRPLALMMTSSTSRSSGEGSAPSTPDEAFIIAGATGSAKSFKEDAIFVGFEDFRRFFEDEEEAGGTETNGGESSSVNRGSGFN